MESDILFEAHIVPHRSLSAVGRRFLMLGMVAVCAVTAIRFWFLGAWPVVAFAALVAAAGVGLVVLNDFGARASELVILSADRLRVVRTTPYGRRTEQTLSSAWLNVVLEEIHGRVPRLTLGLREKRIEVGISLGEAEKRELADALRAVLHQARNPVFDHTFGD